MSTAPDPAFKRKAELTRRLLDAGFNLSDISRRSRGVLCWLGLNAPGELTSLERGLVERTCTACWDRRRTDRSDLCEDCQRDRKRERDASYLAGRRRRRICSRCRRQALPGLSVCEEHRGRLSRREALPELCGRCGEAERTPRSPRCKPCQVEYRRERLRATYEQRKERNLCTRCGSKAMPGKTVCKAHKSHDAARKRKAVAP